MKNNAVELVNLTPHGVVLILDTSHGTHNLPPSGKIARIESSVRNKDVIIYRGCEIEITNRHQGAVRLEDKEGRVLGYFPLEQDGIIYITSGMVMEHISTVYPDRNDVVSPDTTLAIRDEDNRIVGVPSLTRIHKGGV
tara:strand:+ start:1070 stop:1483 length:414 start_codon:yes stop_codon:yes gene_type:complete